MDIPPDRSYSPLGNPCLAATSVDHSCRLGPSGLTENYGGDDDDVLTAAGRSEDLDRDTFGGDGDIQAAVEDEEDADLLMMQSLMMMNCDDGDNDDDVMFQSQHPGYLLSCAGAAAGEDDNSGCLLYDDTQLIEQVDNYCTTSSGLIVQHLA